MGKERVKKMIDDKHENIKNGSFREIRKLKIEGYKRGFRGVP